MKHRRPGALALLAAAALAGPSLGCAQTEEAREELRLPDRATFPMVADVLDRRCATLDCHGAPARNLRLYGRSGLRLAAGDAPGSSSTTDAEYDASYESVVGLEPEVLSLVITEGGRAPERLTLIRKARGSESHKGNAVTTAGDDGDRCMTSWLSPALDEAACASAGDLEPPGDEPDL